jgi:hypothetical protein
VSDAGLNPAGKKGCRNIPQQKEWLEYVISRFSDFFFKKNGPLHDVSYQAFKQSAVYI